MTAARTPRVLFYVQHLLGIGHLKRAATVARAMEDAGIAVTLASGGPAVPGLDIGGARLVQLEAVRAGDRSFKVLIDDEDRPIDDAFKDRRRDVLLSLLEETAPDIVMTELFPFGRRQLRFELLPLLDAAKARRPAPAIVCSVRDILVEPAKPERVEEMLERVRAYYDLVLVHGDPTLVPFDQTFPLADRITDRLRYTGYVVDRGQRSSGSAGTGEVIVSAGGGAVSEDLFRAAMAARRATRLKDATWRLLAGHALPDAVLDGLRKEAPDGVVMERARPDFLTLIANCTVSISQGGYNTTMELMAAGARGVVVPYAGGLETEQTLRATVIGERAGLQVVHESALSADAIAEAVERAMDRPPATSDGLDITGAETSTRILTEIVRARHAAAQ